MQIYRELDVQLTYQNFGSAWLCILRGQPEQVQTAFNGLFNLCATNGELEQQDHLGVVNTFWSNRRAMRRFFFNRFFFPRCSGWRGQGRLARNAMRYALQQLDLLKGQTEVFLTFDAGDKYAPVEVHSVGTISAERPDENYKEMALNHALSATETVDKGNGV